MGERQAAVVEPTRYTLAGCATLMYFFGISPGHVGNTYALLADEAGISPVIALEAAPDLALRAAHVFPEARNHPFGWEFGWDFGVLVCSKKVRRAGEQSGATAITRAVIIASHAE